MGSAEDFVGARAHKLVGSLGERLEGTTKKLTDVASGAAEPSSLLGRTAKGMAEGDSPAKAGAKGVLGGVKDKVKDTLGMGGKGPGGGKSLNIVEDIDVGVPVRDAYNRWTEFTTFSKWAKGVQKVSQDGPVKTNWNVKIAMSKRNWTSTVTEQIPDERIAWESDGPKGTVNGVVTFHPLGENLTKVLLVLEYYPGGLFEKSAKLWRAQGRRARLDLKLYRRFVMMSDDEVEGWRGEIRDGEVVREHEDVVEEEEQQAAEQSDDDYDDEDDYGEQSAEDEEFDDEEVADEQGDDDGEGGDEDDDDDDGADEGREAVGVGGGGRRRRR
jgi:uncharacterized membrane protein